MKFMKHLHSWCKDINIELKRLIVYVGGGVLSIGFVKEGIIGTLSWQDYLAYAFSLTMLYSPSLALHALEIWKGTPKAVTTTTTGGLQ